MTTENTPTSPMIAVLEHPAIGRPLRKFFWLLLRGLQSASFQVDRIFWRLPYVAKVGRTHVDGTNADLLASYCRHLRAICARFSYQPKISVIIPLYKVDPGYFRATLESVARQAYENWEVCVVDDCSNDPRLDEAMAAFAAKHPGKVHYARNEKNSHISITSNHCLKLATGDYVALLDHDDLLTPNALGEMVRHINMHGRPDVLYSDERVVDENGRKKNTPYYKPGWSPFMHLAMNYTTHLTLYDRALVNEVGGFRKGFEGSQDHDLMLRMTEATKKPVVHVPFCLYHWRAHPASTASTVDAKPYAVIAGEKAVTEACARRGRPAHVEFEPTSLHYRVKFELPKVLPLVSIVIPTRDCFPEVERCLTSLFGKSTYARFEVILVDNGTTDSRCLELFTRLKQVHGDRFKVVSSPGPFNFGALNRVGVAESTGEYVVLLNNDTEVMAPDWIEELLRLAQFPEVGAVGAKLLYPDGRVQHAGIVLAGIDIAFHIGVYAQPEDMMYCGLLNTVHETAAVTAACLMVARSKFDAVGGLDELYLPNGYGDVDFCLKLREKGYSNIFTPYAVLRHFESASRKRAIENFESNVMIQRWGSTLVRDPYLNPNLQYSPYFYINNHKTVLDVEITDISYA